MNESEKVLKLISRILLRSCVVAMLFLTVWIVAFLTLGELWISAHSQLFSLTTHELNIISYAGMGLFKLLVLCFLFCPYVGIEWVLRSNKK